MISIRTPFTASQHVPARGCQPYGQALAPLCTGVGHALRAGHGRPYRPATTRDRREMPIQRTLRVCLLLVFTACALAIGVCGAQAATPLYGELSRFGTGVVGNAHAFGVDKSEGNDVFVGSEPSAGKYTVEELSEAGTPLGSVTFTPPTAEFPEKARGIEGIAIDEAKERAYVLVTTLDA